MTQILSTYCDSVMPDAVWNRYFNLMPEAIKEKIERFRRWEDRQAGLLGKVLLLKGMRFLKNSFDLNKISFTDFGKPIIDDSFDFSISHSGSYVILAISDEGKIGVDIQIIKPIKVIDFKRYFTIEEWQNIESSGFDSRIFYKYWTIKESIIKGIGKGLSFPLSGVCTQENNKANIDGIDWFFEELLICNDYACHVAVNHKIIEPMHQSLISVNCYDIV